MKKIILAVLSIVMISASANAFMGFGKKGGEGQEMGMKKGKGMKGQALQACGIDLPEDKKPCMKECHEKRMEERRANKGQCKEVEDRKACMKEKMEDRKNKPMCCEECGMSLTDEQKECIHSKRKAHMGKKMHGKKKGMMNEE